MKEILDELIIHMDLIAGISIVSSKTLSTIISNDKPISLNLDERKNLDPLPFHYNLL